MASDAHEPVFAISGARRMLALLGLLLSMFMTNLDSSIVNVALPTLTRALHANAADTVWVTTAFLLALSCSLPMAISVARRVGRRQLFLIGMPLFTIASLCCSLAPTLDVLILSRVFQGASSSLLFAVVIPSYRRLFPPQRLGFVLGLNAMIVALGTCAGPTLGGLILGQLGWPWLFLINVPIGVASALLVLVGMPHTPNPGVRLDVPGAIVAGAAIASFLLGVHQLSAARTAPLGGCLILLTGLLGWAFVARERRAAEPVLPLRMFSTPMLLALQAAFWSFFGQGVAFVALPFLFQTAYGATPLQSALLFTPWPLVIVVIAPISGRLADAWSPTVLATGGLVLFTLGLLWLARLGQHPAVVVVLAAAAFTGFGFAVFQSPNNREIMASAPGDLSGPAAGTLNINRTLSQSAGAGAVSMALALTGASASSTAAQAQAANGVLLIAVLGGTVAVIASVVRLARQRQPTMRHR
ncbi:MFS transporter [Curtobacterium ammoniigenes]|uniref:MFS transporter n=1 Tax=Curtobacterium ammoniigenes TaxID=395387 RepID=UPI000A3EB089|nr:MFS transporter [Curtobacterium ammoniigenes]